MKIYQNASGSLKSSMGDGCLFYTQGFSEESRFINENLSDNPPVLNKDYATAIWKFFSSADRYALIHVQGSQVVNQAMGRNYPFRGVYEVSRNDINEAGFPLGSIIASMPRIEDFAAATVKHEVTTELRPAISSDLVMAEIDNLCYLIEDAILAEQKVELQLGHQNGLHENGVLSCREFRTLLAAIDRLPVELKRYATFTFCSDEHYASYCNDALINIYSASAKNAPAGRTLPWLDAVKHHRQHNDDKYHQLESIAAMLPGKDRPLAEVGAMLKAMAQYKTVIANIENIVRQKQYANLQSNHWDAWSLVGHNIKEISISSWAEFNTVLRSFPKGRVKELTEAFYPVCRPWKLNDLTESVFKAMPFTSAEKLELQDMALKPFLYSGYKTYDFLFFDTKAESHDAENPYLLPKTLRSHLDPFFIKQIDARTIAGIDKWRKVFEIQNCLTADNIKAFDALYRERVASKVSSQNAVKEICELMEAVVDPQNKSKEDEQILLRMTSTDFKNAFEQIQYTEQGLASLEHLLQASMLLPEKKWAAFVEPKVLENAIAFIRKYFPLGDLHFWEGWYDRRNDFPQIHLLAKLCLRENDFSEAQKLAKKWREKVEELSAGKKKKACKDFVRKTAFVVKATVACLNKSENEINKKMAKKIESLYEKVRYNGNWFQKPLGKALTMTGVGLILGLGIGYGVSALLNRPSVEPKDATNYIALTFDKPLMVSIAELDSTAAGKVMLGDSAFSFTRNNIDDIALLQQKVSYDESYWKLYYVEGDQKPEKGKEQSCTITPDHPLLTQVRENPTHHFYALVNGADSLVLSATLYHTDVLTYYFNLVKDIDRQTSPSPFAY